MQRLTYLATLGLAFFLGGGAAAVEIEPQHRVANSEGKRCGWCALETLARHHNLPELIELAARRTEQARPEDLAAVLDEAKVNFRVQDPGTRNTLILRYAIQEKLGALVGFRELTPGAGRHIVTLVDISADEARVIDSNDEDGQVRTMPLRRFLSWWDGFVLIVEP